jgi:hypothetical protein
VQTETAALKVQGLLEVREKAIEGFVSGSLSSRDYHADVDALTVELDRHLSPAAAALSLEDRATRILQAILADSERQQPAPEVRAAREARRQARMVRLAADDPERYEEELERDRRDEQLVREAGPDEVRMLPPILRALQDDTVAAGATERVEQMRGRVLEPDPWLGPALPDVTFRWVDELSWTELVAGVPCQGCGRLYRGDATEQRPGEPWADYRARLAPVEAEFRSRHPGHGSTFTYGGGPLHCGRCCPRPPLSPHQIESIRRIMEPTKAPASTQPVHSVRHCGTCHEVLEDGHVCRLEDLPKKLQTVVNAILAKERTDSRAD